MEKEKEKDKSTCSFRIDKDLNDWLQDYQEVTGKSKTDVIIEALVTYRLLTVNGFKVQT
ncbi:hypothetical protein [Floridanema aerugineum]|uniref:CopG family transcriptional regulator n=1 Tax=Floridaenema aerugineum BLCC-F46 TaxID=3153654 RepID=A0ABV4X3W7_9CYAN